MLINLCLTADAIPDLVALSNLWQLYATIALNSHTCPLLGMVISYSLLCYLGLSADTWMVVIDFFAVHMHSSQDEHRGTSVFLSSFAKPGYC
jgi:hypothetical protein